MNIDDYQINIIFKNIEGLFYKNERISQNISLNYAANALYLNKGYLSELENGKKKLSTELIEHMNDFYGVDFERDENDYISSILVLRNAFKADFFMNINQKSKILQKYIIESATLNKITYSFFINHLISFYYLIDTNSNKKEIENERNFIINNQQAFSSEQLSIFHCILGNYLKFQDGSLYEAEEHYNIALSYASPTSISYAMTTFQLISLLAKKQKSPLALKQCQLARNILINHSNYRRLVEIDILESNILSFLGMHIDAIQNLENLLNIISDDLKYLDIKSRIYYSLSICSLSNKNYEDSIRYAEAARKNTNYSIDVSKEISYSLYMQGKYDLCIKYINDNYSSCSKENYLFLAALKSKIKNDNYSFETNLAKYYDCIMNNSNYSTVPLVLHFFLNYYSEHNDIYLENKTLLDLNALGEFRLSSTNSELLKALNQKFPQKQSIPDISK